MTHTPSAIQDFWVKNHKASTHRHRTFTECPRIKCADGFDMSVQASYGHYCDPREYLKDGSYSSWEIGFPSDVEILLRDYCEDEDNPTDTVYGYVPTEVIDAVIAKHGGVQP